MFGLNYNVLNSIELLWNTVSNEQSPGNYTAFGKHGLISLSNIQNGFPVFDRLSGVFCGVSIKTCK